MGTTVIGLDVGTNAVRAVEVELGDTPEIRRMGQVGLPIGAVVDGEVADIAAVSLALKRLWTEVGFKDKKVRVGMSSARVIVRTIEMPQLSHDELMSTIRLQLDDYVPLPPDETIFDIRSIEDVDSSNKTQQLLLAATHRDAVDPLIMALNGADLKVTAVDVIPAALATALTWPNPEADDGVDVVLSVGAGTVVVVAARAGESLYSRTVTNVGGRRITEGIAAQLAIGEADAEHDKRAMAGIDPVSAATMLAAATSIHELIGEVRASLSFYAEQTTTRPVRRLLITGGGSLLAGLRSALSEDLGLEVTFADPFARVRLGSNTGFDESDLPYVAPYMAAALGVALRAGRPKDRRIDLSPITIGSGRSLGSRRLLVRVGAVVLVGAGIAFYMHGRSAIADEQTLLTNAQTKLSEMQALIEARPTAGDPVTSTGEASPQAIADSTTAVDIDWPSVEQAVSDGTAPIGVIVTSFQGLLDPPTVVPEELPIVDPTVTVPGGEAAPSADATVVSPPVDPIALAGPVAIGRLTLLANAPNLLAIADWLDSIAADPRFADPWVSGLTTIVAEDGTSSVQLTMDMAVTDVNVAHPTISSEVAG